MSVAGSRKALVRFGAFEADLGTGELRKHGLRVRLQDQPFQVLAALLDRPGEVVTRDELVRRLWADGTVVDYDAGLNAAVTRLRQALSDSAETPRYVETVARRGYRWVTPVKRDEEPQPPVVPAPPHPSPRRIAKLVAAALAVAFALAAIALALRPLSPPDHGVKLLPLTTGLGTERGVSFSRDGTQIVYEWGQLHPRPHVYVKEVETGEPVRLTSANSPEYSPEWSPDGRLIAFLRANGPADLDLYVIPPLGGVERKIATVPSPDTLLLGRFVRHMSWTADSSHVILSVADRRGHGEGLLLVSIADGTRRWLTDPKPDAATGDREPAVSPDGRLVAFARSVLAPETVWLLPLTADLHPAGPPQPLASAGACRSPAWSPDGKEILCTGVSPGTTDAGLSKVPLAGGAPVRILSAGTSASMPSVSRTGRVAFSRIRIESSIWRQEVPPGRQPAPAPAPLTNAATIDGNADYSPDGAHIVFLSDRSGTRNIWTCDAEGAHCRAMTSFTATSFAGNPRWSPDGARIAFHSGAAGRAHVYVVDANGGAPRRITDDPSGGHLPSWSRDGAWIYFASSRSGTNEIWKVPSRGGAPVRITRAGGFVAMEAPDRSALFYTKAFEDADLFRSDLDGAHEQLVRRRIAKQAFVVAQDRIYYLHQDDDGSVTLRWYMLQTGAETVISRFLEPMFLGLALSPDGRNLLYTQMRIQSNLTLAEGVFR